MRWLKGLILAIILLAVLLVGILFAVNNREALPLNLIWIELPSASLSVWLLASLAIGVLLGMLAMSGVYLRLRTLLTRAQRHNQQQRKELDKLRVQELKDTRELKEIA
uniref:LapA family protein n=1 Tax=uncultured Halomonas sp. TaxID=173971 RepID=UPI002612F3D3|nr:LapA family protein [uncultured Halomonas sp.]